MTNLEFFKACFSSEMTATVETIRSMPTNSLEYTPHPINRTAYEIAEHIAAHVYDFSIILQNEHCDEKLSFPFSTADELALRLEKNWKEALNILESYSIEKWDNEMVSLSVGGNPFAEMPRFQMMWFFLYDVIHHRGQLSSYLRPMGGKNPAIYGWSADTVNN